LDKRLEYQAIRQFLKLLGNREIALSKEFTGALDELTPRQREMVRMYYIDQILMRDIAEKLRVNVSTVSRTIARGRNRLYRVMRYGRRGLLDALCEEE